MRIGVDIDDTITNSWECLIPYYSKKFNIPIEKLKQSKPYYSAISDIIPLSAYHKTLLPLYEEVMPSVTLKADVKEVIDKLYELGHTITFITARGKDYTEPYKLTKDYLDKNKIKYDKIVINCGDKSKVCLEEKIDIFIDDSLKHCTEVSNVGIEVLMMETNYNKDCKKFKHVKDWNEIYEYIKGR